MMIKRLVNRFISDFVAIGTAVGEYVAVGLPYIPYVLRHKWFVLVAGLRLGGIPFWRLLVHDWQKFSRAEFWVYARRTAAGGKCEDRLAWGYAWQHHFHYGPHHWEHWKIHWSGDPKWYDGIAVNGSLPMPETYVREMVADWSGASRSYTGDWDMSNWLRNSAPISEENMHPETLRLLDDILGEAGYVFDGYYGHYCLLPPSARKA